ncbi:hypothetical protein DFH07DRAFT_979786 [Mycena maculata]|uniref:Uncharacterized protein n=1 Tax=Mycena maculata TaxID=230809 RepID=A0AAD7N225_9AGAR|nr:hypothetical protein DFH07DRAFT_979786 [Mycena maculata]
MAAAPIPPSTTTAMGSTVSDTPMTSTTTSLGRGDEAAGVEEGLKGRVRGTTRIATGYKGKALRSWPQLPPEVIRLIATFHLHLLTAPLPLTWDFPVPDDALRRFAGLARWDMGVPVQTPAVDSSSSSSTRHTHAGEHEHDEPHDAHAHARFLDAREAQVRAAREEQTKAVRHPWAERLIYTAARDMRALEGLMSVCPQWGGAVEHHPFWEAAISVYDPHGVCNHFGWLQPPAPPQHSSSTAAAPTRATPYHHFRNLFAVSCLPCRISAPRTPHGLGHARRSAHVPRLGPVPLCRDHWERRRARFCGVCLRDGDLQRQVRGEAVARAKDDLARAEGAIQAARQHRMPERALEPLWEQREAAIEALRAADAADRLGTQVSEAVGVSEDEPTFPGVYATCRSCRKEWLWRYALVAAGVDEREEGGEPDAEREQERIKDRDGRGVELMRALGMSASRPGVFSPPDPLLRSTLAAFVDLAEGTVHHVLVFAGERAWLRAQTRWAELMGQALAARKFNAGAGGGGGGERGYAGYATTRLVKSADRPRGRGRSPSPESVEGDFAADFEGRGRGRTDAYENNAANADVYRNAGYTNTSADDYEEEEDYDDSELEDELSEDEDEMAVALETSVKELALGDWARGRVLDGAWVAPADVYYGLRVGGLDTPDDPVKAVHPVPWAVSPPPSPPGHATSTAVPAPLPPGAPPTTHPGPPAPPPPTYALAEAAHAAHMRQMRVVLLPAFRNVVRRVIVECALDAREGGAGAGGVLDPAMRAARMSLADVVREVREEEGVWFDGVDWSERRRNARAEAREREATGAEEERRHRAEGSDDSSAGTPRTSDTSPVLSTSTLGTTPSPPPLGEHPKDKNAAALHEERQRELAKEAQERQPTIAVMPVLDPPRLLRPIPHVPETIAHLPQFSMDALRTVWREACAPLYHCRCSICERAMAAAQVAQGAGYTAKPATAAPAPTTAAPDEGPVVVQLPAEEESGGRGADSVVSLVDDDGLTAQERYWRQVEEEEGPGAREREMELVTELAYRMAREDGLLDDVSDDYSELDDFEEEEGAALAKYALGPAPAAWVAGGGRKRSVDELEPDGNADDEQAHTAGRGGTPPKRARTGERDYNTIRIVKRGSEELDADEGDAETASAGSASKRARVEADAADSPPMSSTPGTLSGEESTMSTVAHEAEMRRRMRNNVVARAGHPPI